MSTTSVAESRRRLTTRQRRRLSLGAQYAALAVVLIALVAFADWSALRRNFADPGIAGDMFPKLITVALVNTVTYTALGFAMGLALGVLLALMRLSSAAANRWLAGLYVEVFRGLPALIIFLFIGFGFPIAFPGTKIPGGVTGQAALALALVSAAYIAESVRAGIQAVPKGQTEAARSLGMSHFAAMRSVVLPQALRIVIPPLTNELVLLLKDSSLVYVLGLQLGDQELTKFGRDAAQASFNITPLLVAALTYLVLTIPLGYLARRLEERGRKGR